MSATKVICDCDDPECTQPIKIADPQHAELAGAPLGRTYKKGTLLQIPRT